MQPPLAEIFLMLYFSWQDQGGGGAMAPSPPLPDPLLCQHAVLTAIYKTLILKKKDFEVEEWGA